jgi:hypothetical protein
MPSIVGTRSSERSNDTTSGTPAVSADAARYAPAKSILWVSEISGDRKSRLTPLLPIPSLRVPGDREGPE